MGIVANPRVPRKKGDGGAGGIRTLDRALQPYNGLANRRLQPLGHSSIPATCAREGRPFALERPAAQAARQRVSSSILPARSARPYRRKTSKSLILLRRSI